MSTTKSTELSVFEREFSGIRDTRQLAALGQLGGCIKRDCAVKSLEGDYLTRAKAVDAKLSQFPKVKASALGQEFDQLYTYLKTSLTNLRTGNYAMSGTGAFRKLQTPYEIEKQAYANYLRMAEIDKLILPEAEKQGDTGVKLDPAVQAAIAQSGTALTPGAGPLPSENPPTNWLLWGGVGAGVLALGTTLWLVARRMSKKAAPASVAGFGRKSRSRRRSK